MAKTNVLIEFVAAQPEAFTTHRAATQSATEAFRQAENLAADLSDLQLEVTPEPPVPMFSESRDIPKPNREHLRAFASPEANDDIAAETVVISAAVANSRIADLRSRPGVRVYANSRLTLFPCAGMWPTTSAAGPVDCRPFQPGVGMDEIRAALGVFPFFEEGLFGDEVVVGILDEGVNGQVYPVMGGFARPQSLQPGAAPVTSHGSMCAADVQVAAPNAVIFDYPFLGQPSSGGALAMFQAVLDSRRLTGVPHITNNSYGFVGVPPRQGNENHEIYDLSHPLHRKIREVVTSGAPAFFAAGNCGGECPSGKCLPSGIGAGRSIHGANSLQEVITVAAVNATGSRIGYSSQGPGMFEPQKPDVSCFSHFFGNFGPRRPGGQTSSPFDNGTSAATPVAAGLAALLTSALGLIPPAMLKAAMIESSDVAGQGWNPDTGFGILNAVGAYNALLGRISNQPARAVSSRARAASGR